MMLRLACFVLCSHLGMAMLAKRRTSLKTHCSCLNWMHVYRSGLARCGEGLELTSLQRKSAKAHSYLSDGRSCNSHSVKPESACKSSSPAFYPMQDHYYCLKTHSENQTASGAGHIDWCYVSAQCKDLRGGSRVNDDVSWKSCHRGAEAALGDLPPTELFALAYRINTRYECEWSKTGQMYPLMAYPWGDPREHLHNASVEDAGKFNTLAVHWGSQLWEVQDEPVCVHGC